MTNDERRAPFMSGPEERRFPLLRGHAQRNAAHLRQSIPWAMLAPHEEQAQRNHGQSLQRLAERGGLSPGEACDVLLGRKWNTTPAKEADAMLERLVLDFEARGGAPGATDWEALARSLHARLMRAVKAVDPAHARSVDERADWAAEVAAVTTATPPGCACGRDDD